MKNKRVISSVVLMGSVIGNLSLPSNSQAVVKTWIGPSGSGFNVPYYWTPGGIPTAGDDLIVFNDGQPDITFGGSKSPIVANLPSPYQVNSVLIDALNTFDMTVTQNTDLTAGTMKIGESGSVVFNSFYISTHNTTTLNSLAIAAGNGANLANGKYILSGTGSLISSSIDVGVRGTGVLQQDGGSVSLQFFQSGTTTDGWGFYNMTAGTMNFVNAPQTAMVVGLRGSGSVNQSGGTISGTTQEMLLTYHDNSYGYYYLSGTASLNLQAILVGLGDGSPSSGIHAQFNQTGGSVTANTIVIGTAPDASSSCQYNFSSGTISTTYMQIDNTGVFTQTGGTLTNTGIIDLESASTAVPALYNLNGGTANAATMSVGTASKLTVNGGTLNLTGALSLNSSPIGASEVALNSGTINAASLNSIFNTGIASISIQAGGALNVSGLSTLATANHILNLSGGTFKTGTLSLINPATQLNWTSGNLEITNQNVTVQSSGTLGSTQTLSSGKKLKVTNHTLTVGSTGTVNLTGGELSVGTLDLGGVPSRLNWTAGTLDIHGSNLTVGTGGVMGNQIDVGPGKKLQVSGGYSLILSGVLDNTGGMISFNAVEQSAGSFHTDGNTTIGSYYQSEGIAHFRGTSGSIYLGTFSISGGVAQFEADTLGSHPNGLPVLNLIAEAGQVTFSSTHHLNSIQMGSNANIHVTHTPTAGKSVLYTKALVIPGSGGGGGGGGGPVQTGLIDLHDNDFVLDYYSYPSSPFSSVLNLVKQGLVLLGGTGNGIGSTEVDNQTIPGTMLAVVDDGDPLLNGAITSLGNYTIFNPSSSILVKYTWFGDSNLDGVVDGSDYALIDTGFTSNGTLGGWVFGDYDYNGLIDGSDYALIDTGFISQSGVLPEPSMLGLAGLGSITMLRRCRPRSIKRRQRRLIRLLIAKQNRR